MASTANILHTSNWDDIFDQVVDAANGWTNISSRRITEITEALYSHKRCDCSYAAYESDEFMNALYTLTK